jgi:pilus assembly protein Flp/PilA
LLGRFALDARGTTAIEYGLIGGLVFLALVVGVNAFGRGATDLFGRVETAVTSVSPEGEG